MGKYLKMISVDSKVLTGKPVIKGTRVPVDLVLDKIAGGASVDDILTDFPSLTADSVKAALYYAKNLVSKEEYYPFASA